MNIADARKRFGKNLRAARLDLKLTQQELADLAGIDRSTVNQTEGGKWTPSIKTAERLARCVGKTIDDLLRR